MKVVCIGDAFITTEMMEDGVRPYLGKNDTLKVFFFGNPDKSMMRDIIKGIEARNFNGIEMPEGLYEEMADADLLVVHLCPIKRDLFEIAKNLKENGVTEFSISSNSWLFLEVEEVFVWLAFPCAGSSPKTDSVW